MRYRLLLTGLMLALGSGCSVLAPVADEPVAVEPRLPPDLPPVPVAEPAPAPEVRPEPRPAPEPEPDPVPVVPANKVVIVLSSRAPAYEAVALALAGRLDHPDVYDLSDRSLLAREAFDAIHASGATAVVAIGLRAAVQARNFSDVPVVFSQVFNVNGNNLRTDGLRGVSALPPLDAQLAAWLDVSPGMGSVGAIVGPGHDSLMSEARAAAAALGVDFHGEVAESDRETLYLFTRMTAKVDGFWLFPDNRILSAGVLREIFAHAAQQGVQVAVFNDTLLELGASVSATTSNDDIANTIVGLLERIYAGDLAALPPVSPLHEVELQIGAAVRRRLQMAEGQPGGVAQ